MTAVPQADEIPFDVVLTPELEALETGQSRLLLGPDAHEGDAFPPFGDFAVRIGDAPVAVRLTSIFQTRGVDLPRDFSVYGGAYDIWQVPHRVSIVRRQGLSEITSVGIEVSYKTDAETCSVISLLPEAQYVDVGAMRFRASSDIHGSLSAAKKVEQLTSLSGSALQVGVEATLGGALAFDLSLATPVVAAMGKGSRRAEWCFEQKGKPLHGHDIETWSLVLLSKAETVLEYDLRVSVVRRLAFLPTRREMQPQRIRCTLLDAAHPSFPAPLSLSASSADPSSSSGSP